MFGLHVPELLILLGLVLVVVGPKRLPEIGKSLGQGVNHFRRGVSETVITDADLRPSNSPEPDDGPPPGTHHPSREATERPQ